MTKYERRTDQQMIADLEAQIAGIRQRAEHKKARADPAIRQGLIAVKALDRGLAATKDAVMRRAFEEARGTFAACFAVGGLPVRSSTTVAPKRKYTRRAKAAVA